MDLKTLLFLLSFIGCCAGEDVLPPGPVDAILGKNVTLKTLVDKPDYTVIIWNFNDGTVSGNVVTAAKGAGVTVSEEYTGRASMNETNGYLTLGPLKAEDSGEYTISIVIAGSPTKTGETELRVLVPVSDVAITSNMPDAIEFNSTVVLTCSAKGSFLKFTWLKGTTPIKADGNHFTVKDDELSSTLTIKDVLRKDLDAPIICTAANSLETERSAPYNVTVYYGPDEVTISPLNPPAVLRAKSNFSLTCTARSNPPASFAWYHDGQKLEMSGPVLTLEVIEKHGLGKKAEAYKCSATNAKTQRVVSSPAVSFSVMEAISGIKITGPTATLIAGNSTANLSCQETAGTVKSTTWSKDGKPLSAGGRLVFSSDMSSMMINPLQKEDNGQYMCQLTNPISTEKSTYKMVVNYGPESVKVTGPEAVEMNDNVEFFCTAASMPPANFTWKFNGTVMPVKAAQYKIEMARYKNSGTYTCEAHNPVTGKTIMHTHTLSVKEEGELDGLSDGAIAGIVIAILVALGAAIALIMYCRQKVPVESPY
ncbi:carcinoembryonic antigen-related cell adhesion molecule 5-like [Plectropomus leopardus]|uniref:carcinoembryonic antigen-related cell adhesion molecule 5-like n=1 Tax=Plectropomus leopardus TaxID=160734 RepID=UPI001C4C2C84|nr:carcinoembryonic antigen-related cell adhesion molecule 5-like [Plectropomus leopardus]